jgi:hypothetical protein
MLKPFAPKEQFKITESSSLYMDHLLVEQIDFLEVDEDNELELPAGEVLSITMYNVEHGGSQALKLYYFKEIDPLTEEISWLQHPILQFGIEATDGFISTKTIIQNSRCNIELVSQHNGAGWNASIQSVLTEEDLALAINKDGKDNTTTFGRFHSDRTFGLVSNAEDNPNIKTVIHSTIPQGRFRQVGEIVHRNQTEDGNGETMEVYLLGLEFYAGDGNYMYGSRLVYEKDMNGNWLLKPQIQTGYYNQVRFDPFTTISVLKEHPDGCNITGLRNSCLVPPQISAEELILYLQSIEKAQATDTGYAEHSPFMISPNSIVG